MYLIVFRSKSETYKFSSLISSYGVKNVIISTPRQISASCGVSCKVDSAGLDKALFVLKRRQFYTYVGVFKEETNGYNRVY